MHKANLSMAIVVIVIAGVVAYLIYHKKTANGATGTTNKSPGTTTGVAGGNTTQQSGTQGGTQKGGTINIGAGTNGGIMPNNSNLTWQQQQQLAQNANNTNLIVGGLGLAGALIDAISGNDDSEDDETDNGDFESGAMQSADNTIPDGWSTADENDYQNFLNNDN